MWKPRQLCLIAAIIAAGSAAVADSNAEMHPEQAESAPFLVIQPVSSSLENDQIILGVLAVLLIGAAAAQLSDTND